MDAVTRRDKMKAMLTVTGIPVSASELARQFGVSRQVIVGDVALLRAHGLDIIATSRGYMASRPVPAGRYVGKIVCCHSTLESTRQELEIIVHLGGEVVDVVVGHPVYGEITGQLNVTTAADIERFMERVEKSETRLLSDLTGGVHMHTIVCRDYAMYEEITGELEHAGLLYGSNVSKMNK